MIEVSERNPVRNVSRLKTPRFSHLLEGQIATIAERHIGRIEARVEQNISARLLRRLLADHAHLAEHIPILHIKGVTVDYKNVFKAVQIHIEEDRLPRPLGRLDSTETGDLRVRSVTAIPEERIARDLGTVLEPSWDGNRRRHRPDLPHPARVLAAHHLDHEKIQPSVAIDVSKINSHRGETLLAHREFGEQTEAASSIVDPDAIHRLEIVAHVDVGETVLVDVTHLHPQSEVPRGRHRLSIVVEKPLRVPRYRLETPPPIVEVKYIRLTHFFEASIDIAQAIRIRP